MSRIQVFDLDNLRVGELVANVNRDWAIGSVARASFSLAPSQVHDWIQFGRMILIEDEYIPPWVGMLDPPWGATSPLSVSAYSAECLFSIRCPDINFMPITYTGNALQVISQIITAVNQPADTYLRVGVMDSGTLSQLPGAYAVEAKDFWSQVQTILTQAGLELGIRPVVQSGRMTCYVDISQALGETTSCVLNNSNSKASDIKIDGSLYNVLQGYSDGATWPTRVKFTGSSAANQALYRLRSSVVQLQGVTVQTALQSSVEALLAGSAQYTDLTIEVPGRGDIFKHFRIGNTVQAMYVNGVYHPGGGVGISGSVRIRSMSYNEARNIITITARIV
jgi:hypothetical protein